MFGFWGIFRKFELDTHLVEKNPDIGLQHDLGRFSISLLQIEKTHVALGQQHVCRILGDIS